MNPFSIWEIILLSIIQGIAEFFPISSSGHLVLAQNLLNVRKPQILLYVVLHLGTLCAIIIYLKEEIKDLIIGFKDFILSPSQNIKNQQVKLLFQLVIATIPTGLIGYFFHASFEKAFGSVRAVGVSLFITGFFLFLTKFSKEKGKDRMFTHPILIGISQGISIVPGISRSGLTIGTALFLGWEREKAAKFSFLLFIPAILGAFVFEISKIKLSLNDWFILLVGFLLTAIISFIFLKFLVHIIKRGSFYTFSFYCIFIGLIAFTLSFIIK